ncbi:hypothetical protein [Sphingomonas sp. CFBP 13733]|uniref:hypothetical protein n=1 Tax=Sphingomonas sp. CFBP 13733 TaxID=2775291 RepID=UPI00177BAB44|nr:hypothetical protein [Sphingomonas sp. CFBP 13733]MBD8640720.1 hypothetical protein [Sphingomonas sp. CFBP 13733]
MNDRLKPEDEPGVAAAEQGQVTLDGPNGLAIAMTPAAAAETGRRLIEAARLAEQQSPPSNAMDRHSEASDDV